MKYYVYKITNALNGKYYIGKRSHKDPYNDLYMGSGKLIRSAIDKYGKNNFIKEIIQIFDDEESCSSLERKLVTKEEVSNPNCYNMHEGGKGGFYHISRLPVEERPNIIALREKIKTGEVKVGGNTTQYFTEETYKKLREASKKGNDKIRHLKETQPEYFSERNKKISLRMTENNSMKDRIWIEKEGTRIVIHKDEYDEYKNSGWISARDKHHSRVKNMKRRWINNGVSNKWVKSGEYEAYLNSGWYSGRISIESQ